MPEEGDCCPIATSSQTQARSDAEEAQNVCVRHDPPGLEQESELNAGSEFLGLEVDPIKVCGLEMPVLRRRSDYFAACAGDLPIKSTGLVLWECGVLLADYLGFARWLHSGTDQPGSSDAGQDRLAGAAQPWWMLHPPAPVVPTRFWSAPERGTVLELGGGCGLVAAVLASLGADVVCTDGDPAALETAAQNCRVARRRYEGEKKQWGNVRLRALNFGESEAAQRLVRELGPFSFIVGSDLLYGDAAPAEPLVETLACLAGEPGSCHAEVVLAVKNRCADEVEAFCRLARARDLWTVRLANADDLPEGYDCRRSFYGSEDSPAYNVIHLVRKHGEPNQDQSQMGRSETEDVALPAQKRLRCDKVDG